MLWRNPDFLKLWTGQAISTAGSHVGLLAIGLTAAAVLQATPTEMGILGMLRSLPFLLFGLVAGAWADRLRRRPLLVLADTGRAALIISVPIAFALGQLSLLHLYAVSFGVGTLAVLFSVSYLPFVPSVVPRQSLHDANAKLALGEAVARVSGPSIAGGLIQVLTAPVALVVDAMSFVVSAATIAWIRCAETIHQLHERRSLWSEIREGLHTVLAHRLLMPLLAAGAWGNLGDGVVSESGVLLLFMARDLRFDPAAIGAVLACLGIGGLLAALVVGPVTRRFGIGATLVGGQATWAIACTAMGVVPDSPLAAPLLGLLLGALGTINPIAGTNTVTLRAAVTPDRLMGRVTAVNRVTLWTAVAVGSLLGGLVAERIGLRATLLLGGVLPLIGCAWLLLSSVRRVRRLDSLQPACSSES